MKTKIKLYLIGFVFCIIFSIGSIFLIKNIGLIGIPSLNDLFLNLLFLICLIIGLSCLLGGLRISDSEFKQQKRNKILKENDEYYQKMNTM